MLITCWSVKGGSGTTVVASSLALLASQHGADTCLVDLAGDSPASLGIAEPAGPGIGHWLSTAPNVPASALCHLEIPVADRLTCLPLGEPVGGSFIESTAAVHATAPQTAPGHWSEFVEHLASSSRTYVVDGGSRGLHPCIRRSASFDLLVTRGCFLALRRAAALALRPSGVIFLNEPGRVLRRPEVEAAAGAPVVAEIPWDPLVARGVDSGLFSGRLPRSLRDALALLPCVQ
jgi:hypothetical protein